MADESDTLRPESTYDQLKALLLAGEISHGEPLVERSIAERFGVSRTPVREAIRQLGKEGLVRVIEGRGAFVSSYNIEDIREIYQVREALEPVAIRIACRGVAAERLTFFEERFSVYVADPSLRERDPYTWQQLGQEFHDTWIYGSRNRRLIQMLESMRDQIELFRRMGTEVPRPVDSPTALDEHMSILDALTRREPGLAEERVRSHLQNALKYRLAVFHSDL